MISVAKERGKMNLPMKLPTASIDPAAADSTLDITGDICPMTFVRTRLALDRLQPGQTLLVKLRGDEPRRNVPRTAIEQGHELLAQDGAGEGDPTGITRLLLRKG
jgi:tRNA 2-thiouridine synthesizing protein A